MKKVLLAAIILVGLMGCKNKENKAKEAIKQYMFEHLHDYKSYEPVSFEKMDSLYKNYSTTEEGIAKLRVRLDTIHHWDSLKMVMKSYGRYLDSLNKFVLPYPDLLSQREKDIIIDSMRGINRFKISALDYLNAFSRNNHAIAVADTLNKPVFSGYSLIHKYRAKTLGGNMRLFNEKFFFDKEIKLLGSRNLDD